MPRKSKYTPELVEQMIRLMEAGAFAVDACMQVGIHEDTYYEWLKTKPEFTESIKKARAKAINTSLLRIRKAAQDGVWQADAWYLERVAPNRFGRNKPPEQPVKRIELGFKPESGFIKPTGVGKPAPLPQVTPRLPRKPIIPRKRVAPAAVEP